MYIEILEDDAELEKRINTAFAEELNDVLLSVAKTVKTKIHDSVLDILRKNDTFESLISGDLVGEFGFPRDSRDRIEAILAKIGESLIMKFYKIRYQGKRFVGGYKFYMIKDDFKDILDIIEAYVITGKNQVLPWLEWLLIQGDNVLISDYRIMFKNAGRSGRAIMVKSNSSSWRVPQEHSGTLSNNWITRAIDVWLDYLEEQLNITIEQILAKV